MAPSKDAQLLTDSELLDWVALHLISLDVNTEDVPPDVAGCEIEIFDSDGNERTVFGQGATEEESFRDALRQAINMDQTIE